MKEIRTKVVHYQLGMDSEGTKMVPVGYDEFQPAYGPLGDRTPTPKPSTSLPFSGLIVGACVVLLGLAVLAEAGNSSNGPSYEDLMAENQYLRQKVAQLEGYIMGGGK